jgi:hypothetical protein
MTDYSDMSDIDHGTVRGYTYSGCRCERCSKAWDRHWEQDPNFRDVIIDLRLNDPPSPPEEPCGTHAGYDQHQRRREQPCDPCLDAELVWRRQQRQKGLL